MTTSWDDKQGDLWTVQVSIADAAAKLPEPSLKQLHDEVREEIGQRPSTDLINYFIAIAKIDREEVRDYYQFLGKKLKGKEIKRVEKDLYEHFINHLILNGVSSVRKFRETFENEYGKPPSDKLLVYYLKKIQNRANDSTNEKQSMFDFAIKIASRPTPTVLKLRNEFKKQFGVYPSSDITDFFLKKIQEIASIDSKDDDYESKETFAKTAANGLILTILQFRIAFEKAYKEPPTSEIIDIFIKNLPPKGEERPL